MDTTALTDQTTSISELRLYSDEAVVEAKDMLWQMAVDLVSRLPETFKFIHIKKALRLLLSLIHI